MRRILVALGAVLVLAILALVYVFEVRQRQGNELAAQLFAAFEPQPLGDIGATKTLRILPLLEYYAAGPGHRGGWFALAAHEYFFPGTGAVTLPQPPHAAGGA